MNREQIIQMARDAGFDVDEADFIFAPLTKRSGIQLELERFAAAIRAATKEEDAKICDALGDETDNPIDGVFVNHPPSHCAKSIRASK